MRILADPGRVVCSGVAECECAGKRSRFDRNSNFVFVPER